MPNIATRKALTRNQFVRITKVKLSTSHLDGDISLSRAVNQMFRVPPLAPVASLVEAVLQDVLQDVVGRLHVPERLPRLRDVHQDLRGRGNRSPLHSVTLVIVYKGQRIC